MKIFIFLSKVIVLMMLFSQTSYARDCPDFINEDGDDKPFCVWLKNNTQHEIKVRNWGAYAFSGNINKAIINDDYWLSETGDIYLKPGELKVIAGIDNDGWGAFKYGHAYFRGEVVINNVTKYGLYVDAQIGAGIVNDFEYKPKGFSDWVDNSYATVETFGGTEYYKVSVSDPYNVGRAMFDAFFTVTEENGNSGYVPEDTSSDVNKINVMNYNTYLLFGTKLDYCKRAEYISDNRDRLFKNVDILVLNEVASIEACDPDALELVTEKLCCDADKPFRDKTDLLNGKPLVTGPAGLNNTGGVIILSRYKDSLQTGTKRSDAEESKFTEYGQDDEVHYEFPYSDCAGLDCNMAKGFLKAKFVKPGPNGSKKDYFIIGTHAQADSKNASERRSQFRSIAKMAESLTSHSAPIIYAGDFNIEPSEYSNFASILSVDINGMNVVSPVEYTYDTRTNYYALDTESSEQRKRYDYVLPYNYGQKPVINDVSILPLTSDLRRIDLSDHHAVLAEMNFGQPEYRELKSIRNDMCLDANTVPYGELTVEHCDGSAEQKWYYDISKKFIRNAANKNACLDMTHSRSNGSKLITYPCEDHVNMKWVINGGAIELQADKSRVLDVSAWDSGAKVVQWTSHRGDNQRWYWSKAPVYRQLKNSQSNLCLDANNFYSQVTAESCDGSDQQKWFYDAQNQYLRNGGNYNMCLDRTNEHGLLSKMITYPCQNHNNLKWLFNDGRIQLKANRAITIRPINSNPGSPVVEYIYLPVGNNQKWYWE